MTAPVVELGATAAERLGLDRAGDRILIGGQWYGVLGILETAGLAEELDAAAILGDRWVRERLGGDGEIAAIYVRARPGEIDAVRGILATAANPGSAVAQVGKLSDLAKARATTDDALTTLGLALAGIALLVGGVGIANTMVVTVLERRGEIGLRRALGARPGQVAAQFVAEAVALSLLGGLAGLALGSAAGLQPAVRAARLAPTAALRAV